MENSHSGYPLGVSGSLAAVSVSLVSNIGDAQGQLLTYPKTILYTIGLVSDLITFYWENGP